MATKSVVCPVCSKSVKLVRGVVARHGYWALGPGRGTGTCRASGLAPVELPSLYRETIARLNARAAKAMVEASTEAGRERLRAYYRDQLVVLEKALAAVA